MAADGKARLAVCCLRWPRSPALPPGRPPAPVPGTRLPRVSQSCRLPCLSRAGTFRAELAGGDRADFPPYPRLPSSSCPGTPGHLSPPRHHAFSWHLPFLEDNPRTRKDPGYTCCSYPLGTCSGAHLISLGSLPSTLLLWDGGDPSYPWPDFPLYLTASSSRSPFFPRFSSSKFCLHPSALLLLSRAVPR